MVKPSENEILGGIGIGKNLYDNTYNNPMYYEGNSNAKIQSTDLRYGEYVRQRKEDKFYQEKMKEVLEKKEREEMAQQIADNIMKKQQQQTGLGPGPAAGPLLGAQNFDKWGNTTKNEFFTSRFSMPSIPSFLDTNSLIIIIFILIVVILVLQILLWNKVGNLETYYITRSIN